MTKSEWRRHWNAMLKPHNTATCPDCIARRKTKRATASRHSREDTLRSLGLTKAIGSVSGRTYWE